MRYSLVSLSLGAFATQVFAQGLLITSFQGNGEITWTNAMTNAAYQVEWASSLTGSWHNSWQYCRTMQSSSSTTGRASVPMFYRVAFDNVTGLWRENHELGAGGTLRGDLSLVQSGTNIAGAYNAENGDRAFVRGSITSNSIKLLLIIPGFVTVTNVGVVNANQMQGTWTDGTCFGKPWSATKQADVTGLWREQHQMGNGGVLTGNLSVVQSGTNIAGAYIADNGDLALVSGFSSSNTVRLILLSPPMSTATNTGIISPNQLNMGGTWSDGTYTGKPWSAVKL